MNTLFGPLPSGDVSACLMGIFSGSQSGSCAWVPQGVLVVAPALVAILTNLSWGCSVVGAFLFGTWVCIRMKIATQPQQNCHP